MKMQGNIAEKLPTVIGSIKRIPKFSGALSGITITVGEGKPYEGEYNVIPKVQAQTLKTRNRTLDRDIIIEEIPVIKTSNEAGGNTVTIGG